MPRLDDPSRVHDHDPVGVAAWVSRCAIDEQRYGRRVTASAARSSVAGAGGPGLGGRLVEHDDERVCEQHPGQGELLGERRA